MNNSGIESKVTNDFYSRLLYRCYLLFVFLIPVSQYWCAIVEVVCVALALGSWLRFRTRDGFRFGSWDLMLYYAMLCFGLFYSENMEAGLKVLETSLGFLAIPIIFSQVNKFKDQLYQSLYAFTFGLIIASLICVINAGLKFSATGDSDVFFFYNLTSVIDSHPTYLAYYLIAAITFGLYTTYYEKQVLPIGLFLIVIAFMYGVLMLTGGVTAYVSMLFILAFFLLKHLLELNLRRHLTNLITVIAMIVCLFAFNRFIFSSDRTKLDDSWERLTLWESAILANPSPILGVGTGDFKEELEKYYRSRGLQDYANANLNAHNQFLDTYFANGLIGLACLLLVIARPLYLAVRNGNILGTLLFFPFMIYGITEVFLGRFQGVVFFILVHMLLELQYQSNKSQFVVRKID